MDMSNNNIVGYQFNTILSTSNVRHGLNADIGTVRQAKFRRRGYHSGKSMRSHFPAHK